MCEEEDKPLCSLVVYACSLSPPQHPKMGTSSPAAAWGKGSPGSQRKYPTLPVSNLFMLHYLSSLHYKIFAHNNQCIHEKGMFTSLFIREIQIKTSRAHPLEGLKLKRQNVQRWEAVRAHTSATSSESSLTPVYWSQMSGEPVTEQLLS